MSENNKIVFTFDTSANKKYSITVPHINVNFSNEDVIAVGEAIAAADVIRPKEGIIKDINAIKHVKTTTTEYTF